MQIARKTSLVDTRKIGHGLSALLIWPLVFMFFFDVSWPEYVPAKVQTFTAILAIVMVGFELLIARDMLRLIPESEFAKPNNHSQIAAIPKKQFVILGTIILSLTHIMAFKGIAEHILTHIDSRIELMERPILGVSENILIQPRSKTPSLFSTYVLDSNVALGDPDEITHFKHELAKNWTEADGKCLFVTLRRGWQSVAAVQALKTGPCRSKWQPSAGFNLNNYNHLRLEFRAIVFDKGEGYPEQPNPFCIVPKGKTRCDIPVLGAP